MALSRKGKFAFQREFLVMRAAMSESLTMPIEHQNRRGEICYLHEAKTAAGKPKFFFSMKKTSASQLESIPMGYEIYESPKGQVFLRKIPPKIVADEERRIVEQGIRKLSPARFPIIDVAKDCIVVYQPDTSMEEAGRDLSRYGISAARDAEWLVNSGNYTAMMRFKLDDKKTRTFTVQRFCFRGAIDDWIFLGGPDDLSTLVQTYAPHLGRDSFFELSAFSAKDQGRFKR